MIKSPFVHRVGQLMKEGKTADEIYEIVAKESEAKGAPVCHHYVVTSMSLVNMGCIEDKGEAEDDDSTPTD